MSIQALSGITFDEQDANLFLVDDARLRADALKHSVLPRLRVVLNVAIALILEIYGIEALDDSIVSVFPNFRQKREKELRLKYQEAFAGLGGKRIAKWPGFSRKDGKPVTILPFRYGFLLDKDGIIAFLENGWLTGLDTRSFEALLRFHIENENKINPLCFLSHMRPNFLWVDELSPLLPLRDQYEYRLKENLYDNHFFSSTYHFPVSEARLAELVENFACFYPVYDSYIQIAKGLPHRLDSLIAKLSVWLHRDLNVDEADANLSATDEINIHAVQVAEKKVPVMPALRWQVFQRDQWKCVACGRGSHDGAILHVDHIIPRSRGGSDVLENFQTLCDVCNIGKSNKDATDLRNKG